MSAPASLAASTRISVPQDIATKGLNPASAAMAGFDVQHILQEGTPDDVRAEVRYLIDTFDRPEGGMCMAAGNGIVAGTPIENIEAFLDEAVRYGAAHRARFN